MYFRNIYLNVTLHCYKAPNYTSIKFSWCITHAPEHFAMRRSASCKLDVINICHFQYNTTKVDQF